MEFRLLIEPSYAIPAGIALEARLKLRIEGYTYALTTPIDPWKHETVPFTCVSYVWGQDRDSNPFLPGRFISRNTLPSLTAAVRAERHRPKAIWIDAFCIPISQPQRSSTLASMGYIYSIANQVVVCLSADNAGVLDHMQKDRILETNDLQILERDEWIRSVWTYQEVVNGKSFLFTHREVTAGATSSTGAATLTSTSGTQAVLDGEECLNSLEYSIQQYRQAGKLSSVAFRKRFPGLDAFQNLVADWRTAAYLERPVLQVLSNVNLRFADDQRNIVYSTIGAMQHAPIDRSIGDTIPDLVRTLIYICERKGDYSFIFTSNNRLRGSWRPAPTLLRAILPWHLIGVAQRVGWHNKTLWLENMSRLKRALRLGEGVIEWLTRSMIQLRVAELAHQPDEAIGLAMLSSLRDMGFSGCSDFLITETGFFYPQVTLSGLDRVDIYVAQDLYWTFGNPGLARGFRVSEFVYVPGVFVGNARQMQRIAVVLNEAQ